jgi:hypothetical protein
MSQRDQLILFLVVVGLGVVASRASTKLAQEVGLPVLAITVAAGVVGHVIARELPD